eukprot:1160125-Pelagomonas_calceolata.AAC.9
MWSGWEQRELRIGEKVVGTQHRAAVRRHAGPCLDSAMRVFQCGCRAMLHGVPMVGQAAMHTPRLLV